MSSHPQTNEIKLTIQGMTCDGCVQHVAEALQGVPGVVNVAIPSWSSGHATITAASDVTRTQLTEAVTKAGYETTVLTSDTHESIPHGDDARYDLMVIGTGGAGMGAAIKGAELGYQVCVVEAGTIGGTCVNIGCVPSKTLIRAAAAYHTAGHHPFVGVQTGTNGVNWKELIAQKDQLVETLRQEKYVDVMSAYESNITFVRGRAVLQPDGTVVINDHESYRPKKIVIATGARPRLLPLDGIDDVEVLTSTSAMALERQPKTLLVIGGRAVALELGQAFARFGTEVTILQRSPRLIPEHEPEIAEALAEVLRGEGLTIRTNVTPISIRQDDIKKIVVAEVDGQSREFRAEQVLMAIGRTPNTQGMGLEAAGVALDEGGFIVVNEFMQTSHLNIYAAGDVTPGPNLVYVAAAGGGIASTNALNGNQKPLDLTVLPDVIFTDPQVARVGLTEAEATAEGHQVKVSTLPLSAVPRALAARETHGLIKLIADEASDRLLGAHVLATEGGEVIQTAALAIKMGIQHGFTVGNLRETLFPYLVQVEGLKLAALAFEKDVSQLSCCAG